MKTPCNATVRSLLLLALALSNVAIGERPVFTDEHQAGVAFQLQGEYEGEFASGKPWGAQVVALGGGMFNATGYLGGLPGKGWEGTPGVSVEGKAIDGVLTIATDDFTIKADGKTMELRRSDGTVIGSLHKVNRISPTAGKRPPKDAVVLFDGTSLDAWNNAKLVKDKYLGATNCVSRLAFQDHQIHIEFRVPFMPESRNQDRGNSGVYVQRRYEVQVLDSFGLPPKKGGGGSIFGIAAPKLNMAFPPLSWQTYDIELTAARFDEQGKKTANARITVRHNGTTIHDNLQLPRACPGQQDEHPDPGALFLQDRGDPVVYRNIWVVQK